MKSRSDQRLSMKEYAEHDDDFKSTTLNLPSGVSRFKLDGTKPKRIDVIPFVAGKGNPHADEGQVHIERTYYTHRQIGPNNRPFICLAETYGKPCPICEERNRLLAEDSEDEVAKALKPSRRQLWNVIDLDKPDAGIQIWDMSHFYFGKQLMTAVNSSDSDEEYEYFADPETGFSLKLTVEEGQYGGRDLKISRVDFKQRKKQYKKSIVKEAVCLDDVLNPLSYKELKRVFTQTPAGEDEEDDSGSSSSSKKGKKMKRKMTAKKKGIEKGSEVEHPELHKCIVTAISKDGFTVTLKDEDDDVHKNIDVAALELVDEDEDEAPKKRGRGRPPGKKTAAKGKKAVEEDEDDDDEEDEDDDSDDEDEEEDDEEESDDDEDDDSDDEESEEEEDDEDEEDEEEEEPAPKKKAKGKRK